MTVMVGILTSLVVHHCMATHLAHCRMNPQQKKGALLFSLRDTLLCSWSESAARVLRHEDMRPRLTNLLIRRCEMSMLSSALIQFTSS
jgi:hypothetical protein